MALSIDVDTTIEQTAKVTNKLDVHPKCQYFDVGEVKIDASVQTQALPRSRRHQCNGRAIQTESLALDASCKWEPLASDPKLAKYVQKDKQKQEKVKVTQAPKLELKRQLNMTPLAFSPMIRHVKSTNNRGRIMASGRLLNVTPLTLSLEGRRRRWALLLTVR